MGTLVLGSMVACGPAESSEGTGEDEGTTGDTGTLETTGGDATAGPATDTGEPTADGSGESTGSPPVDCQPTPSRMVVLGDSIAACAVVGGKDSDHCAPKRLNEWLNANVGEVTYENLSVGGAVTTDVVDNQLGTIEVGQPGHVFVMIYVGGNDLAQYIPLPDATAISGWNDTTGPEVAAAWETILDFLGDPANFPDGVTLLMNTQYNPFDDCTAPPYFVSETKIELLHAHNDALTERAGSREWGFIADQHPSFLGHGHYFEDSSCPYYDPTFEGWMGDLIHPNPGGHHHLADEMILVAQQEIYGGCG